jgi:hypothetical protein
LSAGSTGQPPDALEGLAGAFFGGAVVAALPGVLLGTLLVVTVGSRPTLTAGPVGVGEDADAGVAVGGDPPPELRVLSEQAVAVIAAVMAIIDIRAVRRAIRPSCRSSRDRSTTWLCTSADAVTVHRSRSTVRRTLPADNPASEGVPSPRFAEP